MRTKTMIGLAALAASAVTVVAQNNVYSLNVVGYVNVAVPARVSPTRPSYTAIGNPLSNGDNTIATIFGTQIPNQNQLGMFNGAGWDFQSTTGGGAWDDDTVVLAPGVGFMIANSGASGYNITFVGEVLAGPQTNVMGSLGAGVLSFVSSKVPVNCANMMSDPNQNFTNVLASDAILTFNGAGWDVNNYGGGGAGGWDGDPPYTVPQAFFFQQGTGHPARQNFNWITIGVP